MKSLKNLTPVDLARLALFQSTGNALFDDEVDRAIAKAPSGDEFEVDGVTITVNGICHPACKGARERGTGLQLVPDDPASFECDGIWIGGVEVSSLLNQWAPGLITELESRALKARSEE